MPCCLLTEKYCLLSKFLTTGLNSKNFRLLLSQWKGLTSITIIDLLSPQKLCNSEGSGLTHFTFSFCYRDEYKKKSRERKEGKRVFLKTCFVEKKRKLHFWLVSTDSRACKKMDFGNENWFFWRFFKHLLMWIKN